MTADTLNLISRGSAVKKIILFLLFFAVALPLPLAADELREEYADELKDWSVETTVELRTDSYHAPTPLKTPSGITIVSTKQLVSLLKEGAVLANVLGDGNGRYTYTNSIPGSVWLPGGGDGGAFGDEVQKRLSGKVRTLTKRPDQPVVVYCLNSECWLSYNAALRLQRDGFSVFWYRGGINAWKSAGLGMEETRTKW